MKLALLLLLLLTSSIGVLSQGQQGAPGPPGPRPPPRFCRFRGCVQYEPSGVRWLPHPCTICYCVNGKEQCGSIGCPGFPGPDPCFGYPMSPVAAQPWQCCPRCDFGVPTNQCRAVPSKTKSVSINGCSTKVVEHVCDKIGYRENGKKFRCTAVHGTRTVSLPSNCDPFTTLGYKDVRYCYPKRDDSLFGAEGCDLIV